MDNTQKIVLGVALVTLVVAVIFFFCNRGGKEENMKKPVRMEEPPAPQQPRPPRGAPQQTHVQEPQSEKVIVMFFAPWCGHCKTMEPTWNEFVQNFDGYNGVKLLKINGQENPNLMQIHGVNGFPAVKFCPRGVESPEGVLYQGDRSINSLAQFLQQHA